MNRKLKKALHSAFQAPPPQSKETFLKQFEQNEINNFQFVLTQISYIGKWVWALSFFIFAVAIMAAQNMETDAIWAVSALMPYLAMSAVTESARSAVYGMAELEMSSRFSLKSVLLARMGILGISHFLLLCLLIPLGNSEHAHTILQTGVYMLTPYLLTTVSCLLLVRKIRGKEAIYACMGTSVVVSILNMIIKDSVAGLYEIELFKWWIFALTGLILLTAFEYRKTIRGTEEFSWN